MLEEIQPTRLLSRLRDIMATAQTGQSRLDELVAAVAQLLEVEVCTIYLVRPDKSLELSATYGLSRQAVHQTVLAKGQGLVGRVAETGKVLNTKEASETRGFAYRPETNEDSYHGFCGVPIQRSGRVTGVLVLQSRDAKILSPSVVFALETLAVVLAEMTELGAFEDKDAGVINSARTAPENFQAVVAQEGLAAGVVALHQPEVIINRPIADDPVEEKIRLDKAFTILNSQMAELGREIKEVENSETQDIIETFTSLSRDRGYRRRLESDIDSGLSAEAAVELEQSRIRIRMKKISDRYIRARIADIDDLSNRLLQILTRGENAEVRTLPENAILVARNIGPAELLEYGRTLKAIVLSEGSVGSHAAIIARAWSIPLLVQARGIVTEAREGDRILVNGDNGQIHLRPQEDVEFAFKDKISMSMSAAESYKSLRTLPAISLDGISIKLLMNAGLIVDLPSLEPSGAEGVGLFRTELQFLTRKTAPKRSEMINYYKRVLDSAGDKPVTFRTLDIGSDKVIPFMRSEDEPNPAMGWRAIRMATDRKNILKMQYQCLLRAANGRNLRIMIPFVAQRSEFIHAKNLLKEVVAEEIRLKHIVSNTIELGAMLETPSLAFAPESFFSEVDFLSVGGNDLKQFFFAADRENERVRRRYDTLNVSYLNFLTHILERSKHSDKPVSFCGEDAGRPLEAIVFLALGFRRLSMRPSSIGAVKNIVRQVHLEELRAVIEEAKQSGIQSVRKPVVAYLKEKGVILAPSTISSNATN